MRLSFLTLVFCLLALSNTQTFAQSPVIFFPNTVSLDCQASGQVTIPVRVKNFAAVGGFQFTIRYNKDKLTAPQVGALNPVFAADGFSEDSLDVVEGQYRFSYLFTQLGGLTVADSTVVFELSFNYAGGGFAVVEIMENADAPILFEVGDANGQPMNKDALGGGVSPVDNVQPTLVCPQNQTLSSNVPVAVQGINSTFSDNCPSPTVGWNALGATIANFPNDSDASGFMFNPGLSTVVYSIVDAGGNAVSCSFSIDIQSVGADTLTLLMPNLNVPCTQKNLVIPVSSLHFDSILSLQFSVNWNGSILKFDSVGGFHPQLTLDTAANFNLLNAASQGQLGFSYLTFDPAGTTLNPASEPLFKIYFTVVGAVGSTAPIVFSSNPILQEASSIPSPTGIPAKYVNGSAKILDTTAPVLTCPPSVSQIALPGQTTVTVNGLIATATDNCDATPSIKFSRSGATLGNGMGGNVSGTYFIGTTEILFTATDDAGNTSTCTTVVTISPAQLDTVVFSIDTIDNQCLSPGDTLVLPVFVENYEDIFGFVLNMNWDTAQLSLLGFFDRHPVFSTASNTFPFWADTVKGSFQLAGLHQNGADIPDGQILFKLRFRVEKYPANATVSFSTTDATNGQYDLPAIGIAGLYFANDQTPPSILCPGNITVNATKNECNAVVNLPVVAISDDCSGVKSLQSDHPSNVYFSGTTTVKYTVLDFSNNSNTCTLTVTVIDSIPPKYFQCPKDSLVYAEADVCSKKVFWKEPLLIDGCGNTQVFSNPNFAPGTPLPIGMNEIVYAGIDVSNLVDTCRFLVTVVDTVPPTLTCPTYDTIFISNGNCVATAQITPATTFDACDISIFIQTNLQIGDTLKIGSNALTYTATDNYGNKSTCTSIIVVQDSNLPKLINCPPSDTVIVNTFNLQTNSCGATATWQNPSVTGVCLDASLSITSTYVSGDFFPVGTTEVKYFATNSAGKDSCSFKILVEDETPPIFPNPSFPPNLIINLPSGKCDTAVTWQAAAATDLCGIASLSSDVAPGATFGIGIDSVTYTAVDVFGNSTSRFFTIEVRDVTPPTLKDCPMNQTVTAGADCKATLTWAQPISATDDCSATTLIPTNILTGTILMPGTNTLKVFAFDASQNVDSCTFVIEVLPSGVPDIQCPQNQLFNCSAANVSWTQPTFSGFCTDVVLDSTHTFGAFPLGATTVTFTAKDTFNNTVSCQFTVSVLDNVAPVINCQQAVEVNIAGAVISDPSGFISSAVVNSTCDSLAINFNQATATDNCGNVIVALNSGTPSGGKFAAGNSTVVFKATDAAGLTSTCAVNISVVGLPALVATADPAIGCASEMVTLSVQPIAGATYTWTGPQQNYPNTPVINILSLSPGNTGTYTVFATVNGCKSAASSVNVVLAADPVAVTDNVEVDAGAGLNNINVLLNDQITPVSDALVMLLAPVSGISQVTDSTFAFLGQEDPGTVTFLYQLCSKTCPENCDTAMVNIKIRDTRCVFIPNIISPNGDGINDDFYIPCLDSNLFPDNSIVIYNQWGDKVYEAKPYINGSASGWKGTLKGNSGQNVPDGVYYYVFKTSDSGNAEVKKGFIEVLR